MISSENRTPLFGIMRFVWEVLGNRFGKLGREEKRAARTISHAVIAGLDPAIHAEKPLAVSIASLQHGPPGQARW
jgi:hypothetical protein